MNFTYTIVTSPDGKWGSRNPDGSWNGLIRLIMDGNDDIRYGYNVPRGPTHASLEKVVTCYR
jgi:hypothetical protein